MTSNNAGPRIKSTEVDGLPRSNDLDKSKRCIEFYEFSVIQGGR